MTNQQARKPRFLAIAAVIVVAAVAPQATQ
jgi:hypothetical protein